MNTEVNKLFSVKYEDGLVKTIYKNGDKYYQCSVEEDDIIYKEIPLDKDPIILISYNNLNEVLSVEIQAPEKEFCIDCFTTMSYTTIS